MTTTPATASDSRTRTRLANQTWEATMLAHAVLMRRFTEQDVWEGLSVREYDVLYTLAKAESPLRLRDLGEGVLLSQPALSRLVDRLVQRGLVFRCTNPDDARAHQLSLTDDGAALQRQVGRAHGTAVAEAVTSALTEDEMRLLESLSLRLAGKEQS
ncbi:MarR family winged helix-turn-helix transcriptional regulator [Demequina litorisediminis]|uniref:MarR family transcriptional regulator n=1 Tax=Demequina litorisediminis TaxID=1849022 RepID=A0ABQ6IB46_9MICO|nr:MarR family transcriptional regulator [Demequina litorisediminis]GMA34318.1 MarR family transcriptional regulator [Demequina litorisediminis]